MRRTYLGSADSAGPKRRVGLLDFRRWLDFMAVTQLNVRAWQSDKLISIRLARLKRDLARTVHCPDMLCRRFDARKIEEDVSTQGYAVVPSAFSEQCATILRNLIIEFDQLIFADVKGRHGRLFDLEHLHPAFHALVSEKNIAGAAARILGADLRLSGTLAVTQHPQLQSTYWHQDYPYTDTPTVADWGDARSLEPVGLVVIAMLDEFTEGNGTRVVPGSHRRAGSPDAPTQEREDGVTLVGDPGTIVFMDPRLWHTAQPNQTAHPRVGAFLHYRRWWLRPMRPTRPIYPVPSDPLLRWLTGERKHIVSDGARRATSLLHAHGSQTTWRREHAPPRLKAIVQERYRRAEEEREIVRKLLCECSATSD